MPRLQRYAVSLASGYAALVANVAFSIISVPLAMHYLSNEEFGLWVLAAQVAAYLGLIELGMMGSIGRILIDHKDNRNGGEYGATIKTGMLVLFVQGLLLALVGTVSGVWLAGLFDVPEILLHDFRWLLAGQSILTGTFFAVRMFGFILQAHQRHDDYNCAQIVGFAANLAFLWVSFVLKLGVFSLLAGSGAAMLVGATYCVVVAWRRQLLPSAGHWGRANGKTFRGLFSFGTDVFLLSIGQMLITTSQVLVIGRTLGLEVAAVWSVATKMFTVAQQLVWSIFNYSGAAFSEMVVRGERERMLTRFRDVVVLTASASVVAGLAVGVCNRSFLELWTHGRIAWALENDLLMAISVMVYAITRCHTGLTGLTKEIRAMKYIYLIEGALFVCLSLLTAKRFGLAGIIASGLISNVLCSGVYGVRRTAKSLNVGSGEVIVQWLQRPLRLLILLLLVVTALWWMTQNLPAPVQLAVNSTVAGLGGAWCFWRIGLPEAMQQELVAMLVKIRQRLSGGRLSHALGRKKV